MRIHDDEVRWGGAIAQSIVIPAESSDTVQLPLQQIGSVRVEHPTLWAVLVGLEWTNAEAFDVDDGEANLTADFVIRCGVGSAEWPYYRQLTVQPPPYSEPRPYTDQIVLPNLPALQITLTGRLMVVSPPALGTRTYFGRLIALAAPYGRLRTEGSE